MNVQHTRRRWIIVLAALAALLAGGFAVRSGLSQGTEVYATGGAQGADNVIEFEVAENGLRFLFDETPVHEDGMPAYGNPFVTEGYLYPAGTLNGSNGVLADGSPEFPEKVIGTWICRGYMIGDGAHTTTGAWVISTQTYNFGDRTGPAMMTTEGFELADIGEPVARSVIGGTGSYKGVEGEQTQTLLGFTEQMGVNLRVQINTTNR
ncbi:MAG: hypothetical protein ACRDJE_02970 [Dehalococcoidia bacterium]